MFLSTGFQPLPCYCFVGKTLSQSAWVWSIRVFWLKTETPKQAYTAYTSGCQVNMNIGRSVSLSNVLIKTDQVAAASRQACLEDTVPQRFNLKQKQNKNKTKQKEKKTKKGPRQCVIKILIKIKHKSKQTTQVPLAVCGSY